MGELNIDLTDDERADAQGRTASAPLMIALACGLLLLALFVAVSEADGQTKDRTGAVTFATIDGRVVARDAPQKGVGGVRILVRRVHAGVANFYFDRLTGANGTFEVKYLLPGRYTVEIDRGTVPDESVNAALKVLVIDLSPNGTYHATLELQSDTPAQISRSNGANVDKKKH